jgi:DNA (cytosine-5)-methyltransferase 1
MMLSGFPCQAFSHAGKKLGFKDETRGTLFFNVASIIAAKQPKAFLLENVKGLTTHDQGKTFKTVKKTLENELGYHVSYQILNSKDFGVPHNRPRIYIVGFKDHNVGKGFRFPNPTDGNKKLKHVLEGEAVDPKYYISQQYLDTLKAHRERHEKKKSGFGYVVRSREDIASCLVLGGMGLERNLIYDPSLKAPMHIKGRKTMTNTDMVRKLTHRECEKLQGFEKDWTAGISDTARWEALANSVTVPVIKAIAAAMIKEMTQPSGVRGDSLLLTDEEEFVDSGSLSGDVNEKEKQEGNPGGESLGETTM